MFSFTLYSFFLSVLLTKIRVSLACDYGYCNGYCCSYDEYYCLNWPDSCTEGKSFYEEYPELSKKRLLTVPKWDFNVNVEIKTNYTQNLFI